jgi:hypothetical protein
MCHRRGLKGEPRTQPEIEVLEGARNGTLGNGWSQRDRSLLTLLVHTPRISEGTHPGTAIPKRKERCCSQPRNTNSPARSATGRFGRARTSTTSRRPSAANVAVPNRESRSETGRAAGSSVAAASRSCTGSVSRRHRTARSARGCGLRSSRWSSANWRRRRGALLELGLPERHSMPLLDSRLEVAKPLA